MSWVTPLADPASCNAHPVAVAVPEDLRECYRREGRAPSKINWAEIVAGAAIGLVVTVIAHKIIRVTDNG